MPDTIIKMTGGVIRQQKNTILKEVNIEIQNGEFVYLIGKVGSGKSSFLKTLYAELPLEYGSAEVAGYQLKKIKKSQIPLLRRKCGIVFQDFKLLTDRNVYKNLEFVLKATGWKNKKAIQERIDTVLTKVGMPDKKNQMPHQLSGGEQQRIVLARALLNAPPLLLADEPTGNIDPETSYRLIELLKEICDTGKTIIIATHQYDLIERYPGRVFCCEDGRLYEKIPGEKIESCQCDEVTVTLPEVPENIPGILPEEETPEISDNNSTRTETVLSETKEMDFPETLGENEAQEEVAVSEVLREEIDLPEKSEAEKEDLSSLIGKLDYPDIAAFDYEIDRLSENESLQDKNPQAGEQAFAKGEEERPTGVTSEKAEQPKKATDGEPATPKTNPPIMDLEFID